MSESKHPAPVIKAPDLPPEAVDLGAWANGLPYSDPQVGLEPIPDEYGGGFLVILFPKDDRRTYPPCFSANVAPGSLEKLIIHPKFVDAMKGRVAAQLRFSTAADLAQFANWYADHLRRTWYRRFFRKAKRNHD
jgi:hypothetical protein